jgi:hypothetical protein
VPVLAAGGARVDEATRFRGIVCLGEAHQQIGGVDAKGRKLCVEPIHVERHDGVGIGYSGQGNEIVVALVACQRRRHLGVGRAHGC